MQQSRLLYILIGTSLLFILVLGSVATGQVTQDRTHTIRQSGSGEPVVSVTSSDETVQSRRQVSQQPDPEQSRVVLLDRQDTGNDIQRSSSHGGSHTTGQASGQSSLETIAERREAMAPNVIRGSSDRSPGVERERSLQERDDRRVRRDVRTDRRTVRDTRTRRSGGQQEIVIQQRGQASGEEASIVQQIFVTADALLSGTGLAARSTASGSDASSRLDAVLRGDRRQSDVAVDSAAAADGRAATEHRVATRTADGGVTVRSQEAARGPDAVVTDRTGIRQRDGRVRVVEDWRHRDRRGTGDCFTHTHDHGNERHHGETHIGSHTHSHTHCPGDPGYSSDTGDADHDRRTGDSCFSHTHRHGNERHHGEFHIGSHTHAHTHCE